MSNRERKDLLQEAQVKLTEAKLRLQEAQKQVQTLSGEEGSKGVEEMHDNNTNKAPLSEEDVEEGKSKQKVFFFVSKEKGVIFDCGVFLESSTCKQHDLEHACARIQVESFSVPFWDGLQAVSLLIASYKPSRAMFLNAILFANPKLRDCLRVQIGWSFEDLIQSWLIYATALLKNLQLSDLYLLRQEDKETLESAVNRFRNKAAIYVKLMLVTEAQLIQFIFKHFIRDNWEKQNSEMFTGLQIGLRAGQLNTTLQLITALQHMRDFDNFPEVIAGGKAAPAVQLVPPADPLPLQGPFKARFPERCKCNKCHAFGHVLAFCKHATAEERMTAQKKFDEGRKKSEKNKQDSSEYLGVVCPAIWEKSRLSVAAKLDSKDITVGLDSWADYSLVREDLVKERSREWNKSQRVLFKGVGQATSLGTIVLTICFPEGDCSTVVCHIMPDQSIPADVLLSWNECLNLGIEITDRDKVKLAGKWRITVQNDKRLNEVAGCAIVMAAEAVIEDYVQHMQGSCDNQKLQIAEIIGQEHAEPAVLDGVELADDFKVPESLTPAEEEEIDSLIAQLVKDSDLEEKERMELHKILQKYREVFVLTLATPGQAGPKVQIDVSQPVKHQGKFPSFGAKLELEMMEKVRLFEKHKFIRRPRLGEVVHHVSNLIPIVTQEKTRIVQHLVDLNEATVKDRYPIRNPTDAKRYLHGKQFFSICDEKDSYFQHAWSESSKAYTAFYSPDGNGIWIWECMTQGWCNAPSVLHAFKDITLLEFDAEELQYTFDDSLLMSLNARNHLRLIERFLVKYLQTGQKLNIKKCMFGKMKVRWNGFIVDGKSWSKDPQAIKPILELPSPVTKKQLLQTLGMFTRYSEFIPAYTKLASPMFDLTKQGQWPDNALMVIDQTLAVLKQALAQAVELAVPRMDQPLHVRTDASPGAGMAAVVGQMREGRFVPLAFYSRRLTAAENNYWATELELHCLVWVLTTKLNMFRSAQIVVHNDGKSVKDLLQRRHLRPQMASKRILNDILQLRSWDIEFRWHAREELQDVDLLCRVAPMDIGLACSAIALTAILEQGTPLEIEKEQKADPLCSYISAIKRQVGEGRRQQLWQELPELVQQQITSYRDKDAQFEKFVLEGDRLVWVDGNKKLMVVPYAVKSRILEAFHDSHFSMHKGRDDTMEHIKARFFWPGRSKDVRAYIKSCAVCSKVKGIKTKYAGLQPIQKSRAFQRANFDFLGELPVTKQGNKYCLVMTCPASGRTLLYATKSRAGIEVARGLMERMFLPENFPDELCCSDNALEFVKGIVPIVNKLFGIKGISGNPWNPQVNGAVERRVGVVANMMRLMVNSVKDDWDEKIPFIEYAIDSHVNPTTGMTPRFYITGYDAVHPLDLAVSASNISSRKDKQTFQKWKEDLDRARQVANLHTGLAQDTMKRYFDKGKKQHAFKEGDEVFVFWPKKSKLEKAWHGPYKILKFHNASQRSVVVHCVEDELDRFSVHVDRLLPATERPKDLCNNEEILLWTRRASENIPEEEFASIPDHIPARDVEELDLDEYVVERIVAHKDVIQKSKKGKHIDPIRMYKVRYEGYSPEHDQWFEESVLLETAAKLVTEYLDEHGIDTRKVTKGKRNRNRNGRRREGE